MVMETVNGGKVMQAANCEHGKEQSFFPLERLFAVERLAKKSGFRYN
jgi:hypothetical protein